MLRRYSATASSRWSVPTASSARTSEVASPASRSTVSTSIAVARTFEQLQQPAEAGAGHYTEEGVPERRGRFREPRLCGTGRRRG